MYGNGALSGPGPLPFGWEERLDPNSGRFFYVDNVNRVTQWERPSSAPLYPTPNRYVVPASEPLPSSSKNFSGNQNSVGLHMFPPTPQHNPASSPSYPIPHRASATLDMFPTTPQRLPESSHRSSVTLDKFPSVPGGSSRRSEGSHRNSYHQEQKPSMYPTVPLRNDDRDSVGSQSDLLFNMSSSNINNLTPDHRTAPPPHTKPIFSPNDDHSVHPYSHALPNVGQDHVPVFPSAPERDPMEFSDFEQLSALLLRWFLSRLSDEAKNDDFFVTQTQRNVSELLSKDYDFITVTNSEGELCESYPPLLHIITRDKRTQETYPWSNISKEEFQSMFENCRLARARTRFVAPVLVVKGRYILRSSTLSVKGEALMHGLTEGIGKLFSNKAAKTQSAPKKLERQDSFISFSRQSDIAVLKACKVSSIFDLMLENRKKFYGVQVTSSEKADSLGRYEGKDGFFLNGIPFPGTDGFINFSDFHNGSNVHRWHQKDGDDAYLFINEGCDPKFNDVNWNKYVEWGLFELAANYLRLIVAQIEKNDGGILIHCISGWDRTPLFVFLVRALAWSEGLAHTSLNAIQFLYFTLAYDWMLFRHRLFDRMQRREEVLYFAYFYLSIIAPDDRICISKNCNKKMRRKLLLDLHNSFMKVWSESK